MANFPGFFFRLFLIFLPFQIQTLLYKADFFSGQFNYFTAFFLQLSEVFLVLAVLFWAINTLVKGSLDIRVKFANIWGDLFLVSLAMIFLWTLLGVFGAPDKTLALLSAFRWLEVGMVILLIEQEVIARERILVWLWWGGLVQVLIGLGQYLRQADLGLWFLGEARLGADYFNIAKIELGGERILRAYGTMAHANVLGGFIFVCLGLLMQKIDGSNWVRYGHFAVFFLIGLIISFSRSAWAAVGVLVLVFWFLKRFRCSWKYFLLVAAVLLFVTVLFGLDRVILTRILDFSTGAWEERMLFLGVAMEMIFQDPWTGVGVGSFVLTMPFFGAVAWAAWLYQPVHNFFLMILSESGFPGLFAWILLIFTVGKMLVFYQRRKTGAERDVGRVYWALLAGMLVLMMVDHYLYTIWVGQALLGVILGFIYSDYRKRQAELAE